MYDDDRDALAAEYVLGTLSVDERDQAEALLAIDPGFAEIVRVWECRLGELNVMVEAVEPPADLWDKIKTEIGGKRTSEVGAVLPAIQAAVMQTAPEIAAEMTPEPASEPPPELLSEPVPAVPEDLDDTSAVAALASSLSPPEPETQAESLPPPEPAAAPTAPKIERSADVIFLARKAKRWQGVTVAVSAIAALLAIYIGVDRFMPELVPHREQAPAVATAPPPSPRYVAVLQQEPTAPAFLLTFDPQNRTMTVRRMTAAADAGRSYELWLIPSKNPSPRSLGIVGGEEFTTRPLPANFDVDAMRGASYAVSLEPAGGSPRGAPTGPILFTGKMVESLPGSPPG
jgi:anti-sigma-K factor RskA